jgi:hypothetical protein
MDGHERWEWDMLATALARLETPGSAGADYLLAIVEGEEFRFPSKGRRAADRPSGKTAACPDG